MISRVSISKQISKGGSMPYGPGTYGSKVGRPPKKKKIYKKGGFVKKMKYNKGGSVKKTKKG
jgi:hypothetical protein